MYSETMRSMAHEIADYAAESPNWKARVAAFSEAIGVSWARGKTLYYATARTVKAEEFENAKEAKRQFIEAKKRREDEAFAARLRRTIEHLKTVDPDFYGADIARLERVVALAGLPDRAGTETESEMK